jgi:hypothetical protein
VLPLFCEKVWHFNNYIPKPSFYKNESTILIKFVPLVLNQLCVVTKHEQHPRVRFDLQLEEQCDQQKHHSPKTNRTDYI